MISSADWQAIAWFSGESVGELGQVINTTAGRRDKRGSPVDPQAIGMAWVLPCRSVGARAAPCIFSNAIKDIFGTVSALAPLEARP